MSTELSAVREIRELHSEISDALRQTLPKAIRIGELLTEQKARLEHGAFLPWVKQNLPFTDRTARNYMRMYRERARLKSESVSDLTTAYKLLTASTATPLYDAAVRESQAWCVEALERLQSASSVEELTEIVRQARHLEIEFAELRLRAQRGLGVVLSESKR